MNSNHVMYDLIASFPAQIRQAVDIGRQKEWSKPTSSISNVLIAGMGGSGIGGSIIKELAFANSKIPIEVLKDYHIPAFVSKQTLFIACSYSGNTEETIQATQEALLAGAQIKIICSGGILAELAKSNALDQLLIPGGMPPRACLGYALVGLTQICAFYQVIPNLENEFLTAADLIDKHQQDIKTLALQLSKHIGKSKTAIYAVPGFQALAIRFAQQLHENAKQIAWTNCYPELNHNELVSWAGLQADLTVVVLDSKNGNKRNKKRIYFSRQVIKPLCKAYFELEAQGTSHLQEIIYYIHLVDFISWYTSLENNVDAMNIEVIENLKQELSAN